MLARRIRCLLLIATAAQFCVCRAADTLDFYFVDVGQKVGNGTVVIAPSGQSLMLDAGPPKAERFTLPVLQQAGVQQLDYLINTHFCGDHFGATAALAKGIPIRHFVEHGPSVEYHRDYAWWKVRRFAPTPIVGDLYDKLYETYLSARESGRTLVVQPGDVIPIQDVEVRVVCAGGKVLSEPLPGAGQPNPAGADVERRFDIDAEDGQSIGVLIQYGKFRFVFLGDLTWNVAHDLFYPRNLVGTVDAYVITHHAQSLPQSIGEFMHGLSSCPKSEVHALQPRVAILSLGMEGHLRGDSGAMEIVRSSPGLEDVWQTELVRSGGEKDHNSPPDFCANISDKLDATRYIKLSAHRDGSFTVTNSRNGFSKEYVAR